MKEYNISTIWQFSNRAPNSLTPFPFISGVYGHSPWTQALSLPDNRRIWKWHDASFQAQAYRNYFFFLLLGTQPPWCEEARAACRKAQAENSSSNNIKSGKGARPASTMGPGAELVLPNSSFSFLIRDLERGCQNLKECVSGPDKLPWKNLYLLLNSWRRGKEVGCFTYTQKARFTLPQCYM